MENDTLGVSDEVKKAFQRAQMMIVAGVGGVVRSLFFTAEFLANIDNTDELIYDTLFWGISTIGVIVDVLVMGYNYYDATGSLAEKKFKSAAMGMLVGMEGLLTVGAVATMRDDLNEISMIFALLGFCAIAIRPGVLFGTVYTRSIFIAATTGLIFTTGGIKITTGVMALLPSEKRDESFNIHGSGLALA